MEQPNPLSVTWREYFDQRLTDLDARLTAEGRTVEERFKAMDKAISIASIAQEQRWVSANEFRASLNDMAARGITRPEFDALRERMARLIDRGEHDALCAQVAALNESRARLEGKASQASVNVAYVLSALSLLIGMVGIVLRLAGL